MSTKTSNITKKNTIINSNASNITQSHPTCKCMETNERIEIKFFRASTSLENGYMHEIY